MGLGRGGGAEAKWGGRVGEGIEQEEEAATEGKGGDIVTEVRGEL